MHGVNIGFSIEAFGQQGFGCLLGLLAGHPHKIPQGTQAQFIEMREARDATLSMPTLILQSVQTNMRAGAMPPAEENGVSYLKIPINAV